ncbi:MAG: glutamate--tRNA ligase [bacterium]
MSVRVRFAPSPTGNVHIGNIRVAIFNWLFARHEKGKFLLRVEDTDLERSTPEAIRTLLDSMNWLGLDYDEEPVYQTKQLQRHKDVAMKMVADGFASSKDDQSPVVFQITEKLFDSSFVMVDNGPHYEYAIGAGELIGNSQSLVHKLPKGSLTNTMNWQAIRLELTVLCAEGDPIPGDEFEKTVISHLEKNSLDEVDVRTLFDKTITGISFRRKFVFFDDLVLGTIKKPLEGVRDFVIMRTDGSPIFHLANVIDDVDMGITHVLRGNDHVENTFRHLFLYKAMGVTPPLFGHFPMITNDAGKPYSKRDGAAFVGEYRELGFFPDCLFNMLVLCGWNPGDDREIMSKQEMIDAFTLDHVSSGPAQFSLKKIHWMNSQYFMKKQADELFPLIKERLAGEGVDIAGIDESWLERLIGLLRERSETLSQFVQKSKYFFEDEVTPDPKAVNKILLKNDGAGMNILEKLVGCLEEIADWSEKPIEESLTKFTESEGIEFGAVAQPLRVAVTGGTASPGIWETLALVGKTRTLARIDRILRDVKPQ